MSVNHVILIGRLGRDPEVKSENEGIATLARLSLATDERELNGGEFVEYTEWHNITVYGNTANFAKNYLKKGALVYVEGKIQSRKYIGKDGIERTAYNIICQGLEVLQYANEKQRDEPENESDIPF